MAILQQDYSRCAGFGKIFIDQRPAALMDHDMLNTYAIREWRL
jgi:hypothetical protein